MKNSKFDAKYLILAVISLVMVFLAIQLSGPSMTFLACAPLIALSLCYDKKLFLSVLVPALAIPLINGVFGAFLVSVPVFAFTVAGSYLIQKNRRLSEILLAMTGTVLFSQILLIWAVRQVTGIDFISSVSSETYNMMLEIVNSNIAPSDPGLAASYKTVLNNSFMMLEIIMPAILIILSMIFAYLSYFLTGIMLKIADNTNYTITPFRKMRFGRSVLFGFVLFSIILLTVNNQTINYACTNVIVILSFLLLINAISLIDTILTTKGLMPYTKLFIYLGICLCIVVLPVTYYLLTGLGTYDTAFNIRERFLKGGDKF